MSISKVKTNTSNSTTSNPADFIIRDGCLEEYVGPGGDVVIPEGVTGIGL